jgi:hypothetical protein
MEVFQANLNKCRLAQIELTNRLKQQNSCLALIQEPYCFKGRLSLLPQNITVFPSNRDGGPRASILVSKHMQAKEVTNLVSRDLAVCLVKLDNRTTVIASLYLDITKEVVTQDLVKLLEFTIARRYALLLAVDSNAHNTVWGHKNNSRGEALLDFI